MQLKREAKLLTVIGLNTKHADCRIIFLLFTELNMYYFSNYIGILFIAEKEMRRKVSMLLMLVCSFVKYPPTLTKKTELVRGGK